jgi:alpha-N-arabinofuranosidase
MKMIAKMSCAAMTAAFCALGAFAQTPATLTVDTTKPLHAVSPMLYGLMTEEINHSYDGGLYAQMLSNHVFRTNWAGVESWGLIRNGNAQASADVDKTTGPSAALPTSLKLTVSAATAGNEAGLSNPGYWGMAVRPHMKYTGSFYAKADGDVGTMTARLVSDASGAVLAQAVVSLRTGAWSQYTYTLETGSVSSVTAQNHLELTVAHAGTIWLQLVTLFPPTYHDRANGNRADLMEMMAAMHPHFLRLPGGNYLEGDTLNDWYNWPKTIGPLVDRPGHMAPWTYWSTDGMGLLEFLEWTEDLKIEPVLAVYAGYSLRSNSGGRPGEHIKPGKDLEPYVQAAVDEVEYVTGDVTTKWGAERARDGHPTPFPLTYVEIGNEDWFDTSGSYDARFAQIAVALRKKYPQLKLITTAPIKVSKEAEPDVLDDHYYKSPAAMFDLVHRYDDAPRGKEKIFVGEWATRSGSPTPNFGDALGDAAWMTGMERNSDLIVMASYAPLFVNVNPGAMQWPTDLIGYDAVKSYGSPSYYAQSMFAGHLGNSVVQSELSGAQDRFFTSATVSDKEYVLHLKLVNASNHAQALTMTLKGARAGVAKTWSLHAASFAATNSITEPDAIRPKESTLAVSAGAMRHTVPAYTIEVIDIPVQVPVK